MVCFQGEGDVSASSTRGFLTSVDNNLEASLKVSECFGILYFFDMVYFLEVCSTQIQKERYKVSPPIQLLSILSSSHIVENIFFSLFSEV